MAGDEESFRKKIKTVAIPYHVLDYSDNRFTDDERKYLRNQLRSMFAFVGCIIPDSVTVDGVGIPLRDVVWKLITKDKLSDDELSLSRELLPLLDKKVKGNRKMIEDFSLTDEEAEKLYFEACGLLKAIVTLRGLDQNRTVSQEDVVKDEKVKDAKRLIELLRRIR